MSESSPVPLLRDFGDWYSPMVVKEMRSGLRTRFFSIALIQLHVLLALLMVSALLGVDQEIIKNIFWSLTLFLLLVVMPLRGFGALTVESQEGTLDMLTLTSISSFRIVFGKWAALFSQTLLIASSLLPYLIARYHFGGVEIPREVLALIVLVLGSALGTAAIVAFSSQKSLLLRLLLTAGVFLAALPLVTIVMVGISTTSGDQMMNSILEMRTWERIALSLGIVTLAGYGVYVFLTLGASRVASSSENHSTVKRVAAMVMLGFLTVLGSSFALFGAGENAVMWTLIPAVFLTLLIGMDVMTEDMPRSPAVTRPFVVRGPGARIAGRLLYPGWASGVPFYFTLCLAPLIIWAFGAMNFHHYGPWTSDFLVVLVCLLTANVVPACLKIRQQNRFVDWWIVQLILFTAGIVIEMIIGVTRAKAFGIFSVLTPGTALIRHEEGFVAAGVVTGLIWSLIALSFAVTELQVYRKLENDVSGQPQPPTPAPHEPA